MNTVTDIFNQEVFVYREEDGSKTYHFNMTAMRKAVEWGSAPRRTMTVALSKDMADCLVKNAGVEEWKISQLQGRPDIYLKPIIVLDWDTGHQTVLDGNHRTVLLYRQGRETIEAYYVSLETAMLFSVDMPSEMSDLALGIKTDGKGNLR